MGVIIASGECEFNLVICNIFCVMHLGCHGEKSQANEGVLWDLRCYKNKETSTLRNWFLVVKKSRISALMHD